MFTTLKEEWLQAEITKTPKDQTFKYDKCFNCYFILLLKPIRIKMI